MRTWLNKNFGFSKAEFNGLLVLVFFIIVLRAVPYFYDFFHKDVADDPSFMAKIQKIEIADQPKYGYNKDGFKNAFNKSQPRGFSSQKEEKLFAFDPNTIGLDGWKQLGLSPKQAQAIVNYTTKGGKFYKPEDLQKMYTVSPQTYKRLFPFIKIEAKGRTESPNAKAFSSTTFSKKAAVVIEINNADSLQLQQIRGIGSAFARRILAYRDKLGGFVKKEQLREVYGLDSAKYEEIKEQVSINLGSIKLININTADFEALKRFPYLSYKQMNAIIQYRKQHGNFKDAEEMKKVAIINQATIDKIVPYLAF